MNPRETTSLEPFLTFRLGRRTFAVPAAGVRECLWLPRLTALEGSPAWVLGTFDLRGTLVTVISLDIFFGHPPPVATPRDQLLLVERPEGSVGIHASEVLAVDAPERLMPLPEDHRARHPAAIRQEVELAGRILPVVETAAIPLRGERYPAGDDDAEDRLVRFEAALDDTGRQTLEERARTLGREASTGEPVAQQDFVLVELGGETFALPAERVSELAPLGAVAPAPATPAHIRGFAGLRGEVITLVDVRPTLGVEASPLWEPPLMVVFLFDRRPTGIPIDRAIGVARAGLEPATELPVAIQAAAGEWTRACIHFNDRLVPVLDLESLLLDGGLVVDDGGPAPAVHGVAAASHHHEGPQP